MVCENCQKLANDVDLWKTKYKELKEKERRMKEILQNGDIKNKQCHLSTFPSEKETNSRKIQSAIVDAFEDGRRIGKEEEQMDNEGID